jgi:hypothetical protein
VRRPIHLVTGLPAGSSRQTHQTAPAVRPGRRAGNCDRMAEDDAPPSGTTRAPCAAEAASKDGSECPLFKGTRSPGRRTSRTSAAAVSHEPDGAW